MLLRSVRRYAPPFQAVFMVQAGEDWRRLDAGSLWAACAYEKRLAAQESPLRARVHVYFDFRRCTFSALFVDP